MFVSSVVATVCFPSKKYQSNQFSSVTDFLYHCAKRTCQISLERLTLASYRTVIISPGRSFPTFAIRRFSLSVENRPIGEFVKVRFPFPTCEAIQEMRFFLSLKFRTSMNGDDSLGIARCEYGSIEPISPSNAVVEYLFSTVQYLGSSPTSIFGMNFSNES